MKKPNMFCDLLYTISKWFSRYDQKISKFIVLGTLGSTLVGMFFVFGFFAFQYHILVGILYVIGVFVFTIYLCNNLIVEWYENQYEIEKE